MASRTFAADTAAILLASARLTAETGIYYCHDPSHEYEQLFAGTVLNYDTAAGSAAKNAAYSDLFR